MARPESPCLSIAIARLRTAGANHFATWVLQAPYPSGYVHHDCMWPDTLSQAWQAWQEMFSPSGTIHELPLNPDGSFGSPETAKRYRKTPKNPPRARYSYLNRGPWCPSTSVKGGWARGESKIKIRCRNPTAAASCSIWGSTFGSGCLKGRFKLASTKVKVSRSGKINPCASV